MNRVKVKRLKRVVLVTLGTVFLLFPICVNTARGNVSAASTNVSYIASRTASYTGHPGRSWTVTATLEFDALYECSWEGDLPSVCNCTLSANPNGGTFTVSWDIHRPILPDSSGSTGPLPLPVEGLNLLGDYSLPIVPIDIGSIEIVLHGHMIGDLSPSHGLVNPPSIEWSTWGSQETELTSSAESVVVELETRYSVYATVAVYVANILPVSIDSSRREFPGNEILECVIPEFPSVMILPIFMVITLLAAVVYRRKRRFIS